MSDHLGLSFKFLFKPVAPTPESGKFYTKSEWSKINREMYAATSDSNLNKIKVPYHLLLHGSKNQIALDVYLLGEYSYNGSWRDRCCTKVQK